MPIIYLNGEQVVTKKIAQYLSTGAEDAEQPKTLKEVIMETDFAPAELQLLAALEEGDEMRIEDDEQVITVRRISNRDMQDADLIP